MELFIILSTILTVLVQSFNCQQLVAIEVAAKLTYPTHRHASVYDGNDTIFILGGFSGAGYSIGQGTIRKITKFPSITRNGFGVFNEQGDILYMGGHTEFSDPDGFIYKLELNTLNLQLVETNQTFGLGRGIRAIDGSNTIFILADDGKASFIYCLNLSNFEHCGGIRIPLLSRYSTVRPFVYGGHAYLTGASSSPGFIEKLNLETLESELVDAKLPVLISHDVVFDGTYAYIIGSDLGPGSTNNGIIRLDPQTMEHEFFNVQNFPADRTNPNSYWYQGSAVYVGKLNRIYFSGGYTYPNVGLRDEIWYIDLDSIPDPGSSPTISEEPISTTPTEYETTPERSTIPEEYETTTEKYFTRTTTEYSTTPERSTIPEEYETTTEEYFTRTTTEYLTTPEYSTTPERSTISEEPSSTTQGSISTTLNPDIFTCFGKPQGFYPNPYDCAKFIACHNGAEEFYECPEPLLFSPILLSCTNPEDVDCDISCTGKPDGMYVHPHDCSLFINCNESVLDVYKCPEPLLFDPVTRKCNFPEEVQCRT